MNVGRGMKVTVLCSLVLSATLVVSAFSCRLPKPVETPVPAQPGIHQTGVIQPVVSQPEVISAVQIFKAEQPFPPSGGWVRVSSPTPYPTAVQQVFNQNDRMFLGVRINPEYSTNVTFSKYTVFNTGNRHEEEIVLPGSSGPFKPGQTVQFGLANPWSVPNQTGTYEIRIYRDGDIVASAVFEVVRKPANSLPVPNAFTFPRRISIQEANTIVSSPLPTPAYLPENYFLSSIYILELSDARSEVALAFYPKGSVDGGITNIDEAPIRMYLRLSRGGQMGGLKIVGIGYDIVGAHGVLVAQNKSNQLWWDLPYKELGQYEMVLEASKDIPEEELVKIARSVPH